MVYVRYVSVPSCKRHLRKTEHNCPFCGVELRSSQVSGVTALALGALVLLGSAACSSGSGAGGETAGSTTSPGETVGDSSESGMVDTETDTDDGPNDTDWTSGSFYGGPTDFPSALQCDPWWQDCPDGDKCVPYASTGTTWDANKCVPILGDGQPGEACKHHGVINATDSCAAASLCWNLELIDGELLGTCTPFCTGTANQPQCAEGQSCLIANDGSVNVCLQACDPILQDCPAGLGCHWLDNQFACVQTIEESPNQSCDDGECPAGSTCVQAALVPGCAGTACCTSFCSLDEPSCEPPTSACMPFFDQPVDGYEHVGVCVGA